MLAISVVAPLRAQAYSGGAGTPADPYRIATPADLRFLSATTADWASNFRQTADILLDTANFLPIGSSTAFGWAFRGSYDAEGHSITGLRMRKLVANSGYDSAWGFFGTLDTGAAIRNLRLLDVRVQGSSRTGGMAGLNRGKVTNCMVTGAVEGTGRGERVGGLIGYNRGWVTGCHSAGSVQGLVEVGGLIGFSEGVAVSHPYDTLVQKSSSTSDVVGDNQIGGLIGHQDEWVSGRPSLAISFATGTVRGNYGVGGLVGYLANGELNDVYAMGKVQAKISCGGLVGDILKGKVLRGYSTGPVNDVPTTTGGLIGRDTAQRSENSFWDTAASGLGASRGGAGKSTAEMKAQTIYISAGWSFTNTWTFSAIANQGYPIFQWQSLPVLPAVSTRDIFGALDTCFTVTGRILDIGKTGITAYGFVWNTTGMPERGKDPEKDFGTASAFPSFSHTPTGLLPNTRYYVRAFARNDSGVAYGQQLFILTHPYKGSGMKADPYRIVNKADLGFLSTNSGEWRADLHYLLTSDIAFTAADFAAGGAFENKGEGFRAIGKQDTTFQGSFDGGDHEISGLKLKPNGQAQGLFGTVSKATLKNLGVVNFDFTGNSYLGGLVGSAYCGTGPASKGEISRVYVTGKIEGSSNYAGGLAGSVSGCPVSNTFAFVTLKNYRAGGLIGVAEQARISNSFARGEVAGDYYSGGLIQELKGDSSWVENCYSTGLIKKYTSTGTYGGLIGTAVKDRVFNSFWDRHTSVMIFSAAGTGKSTDEMKDLATFTRIGTTGLDTPWDFAGKPNDDTATQDIWSLSPAINDGYPYLKAFTRFPVRVWDHFQPAPAPPGVTLLADFGSGIRVKTGYAARIRLQLYSASGSMISDQETSTGANDWAHLTLPGLAPGIYLSALRVEDLHTGRIARFIRKVTL